MIDGLILIGFVMVFVFANHLNLWFVVSELLAKGTLGPTYPPKFRSFFHFFE